jgi:EAL domain-containing protein (putative c-di-GMP-specific phosphodiesterase class I)
LRHFPVNYIKLDRSFIFEEDWEIANLVTDLAHKLDLDVIAEGVERPEQLNKLRELNCDFAQGNYFSADVNADKAGLMLQNLDSLPNLKPS